MKSLNFLLFVALLTVPFAGAWIDWRVSAKDGSEGYKYIVNGIGYDLAHPIVTIEGSKFTNIKHLNQIVAAISKYENDHYSFPVSRNSDKSWCSPALCGSSWLGGLGEGYLDRVPSEVKSLNDHNHSFLYRSNGIDFKLIAFKLGDCEIVKESYKMLVDPVRECFAYGYWTEGAKNW